jgi:dTDP-4-dehydrorhamnose 3,5-epimerase
MMESEPAMQVERLEIPEVLLLTPKRFGDKRGWLSEVYSRRAMAEAGLPGEFVQDNQAFSPRRGTLRGLHLQLPPKPIAKLVRCIRGAIFDVAVDVRAGSPTFGRWVAAELTADNGRMMLSPRGFAHAYCSLTDDCEVLYKLDDYYAPECESGLAWNDPAIGIDWPIPAAELTINARDQSWGPLAEFPACDFS